MCPKDDNGRHIWFVYPSICDEFANRLVCVGCGMRRSDSQNSFAQSRQLHGHDQYSSSYRYPLINMRCRNSRWQHRQASTDPLCQYWFTERCSAQNCAGLNDWAANRHENTVRMVCAPRNDIYSLLLASFLGARAVSLRRATVQGQPSILALSSRTWLTYVHQGVLNFDPLIFDALDYSCGLSAKVCPEGIIGVTGDTLRSVRVFFISPFSPNCSRCETGVGKTASSKQRSFMSTLPLNLYQLILLKHYPLY